LTVFYKNNIIQVAHKVKNMEEKRKEKAEEKRKFWQRKTFWTWMGMAAVIALIVPIAIRNFLPEISWLPLIGEVLTIIGLGLWLKKCLRQVGKEVPAQAVLTRFAKPIDAVGMGLYFVLWPFEDLVEYPTGQYALGFRVSTGLYSKEKGNLASQPMEVEVYVYFRFPRVDKQYTYPLSQKEYERLQKEKLAEEVITQEESDKKKAPTKSAPPGFVMAKVWGKYLLMEHTYYRLPFKGKPKTEDLGKFFEGGVIDAVRKVMSEKDYIKCREEHAMISEEIKDYLSTTPGNPFLECGIPAESLAIAITKVRFPPEMEEKFYLPELKKREAEAAKSEKERMITLAEGEQQRINLVTKAYIEQGVPPEIAGMLGGVAGKAMTFDQLRDLAIFQALGGFRKREISKSDVIEALQKLTPEEIKELLGKISKKGVKNL
jgi:regulator of protease activity HflC (stomatin/prohibitin superfamily)